MSRPGNSDTLGTLVKDVLDLSGVQVVELEPKDLSAYGLDKPSYQVKLDSSASDSRDDSHVARVLVKANITSPSSALPVVMTVDASSLKGIDLALVDYVDRFVNLQSIWTVSSADFELGDLKFQIAIEMDKGQKATDEGVVFKLNGQDANIKDQNQDSLFNNFYMR